MRVYAFVHPSRREDTTMSGIPPITDEQFQALRATARSYTVVILTPGPNRQSGDADATIYQHGMRNAALHLAGVMPVVCPSGDSSEFRGLSIFNASVEEVTELMNDDPAVQAGVLEYQVHPVRSFPGSTLPD
jgi:hypothetical protein